MRYRPKDQKTTVLIIVIAIVAVFIAKEMGFASTRSATRILYSSTERKYNWTASYAMLDGTMQKTVHTVEGNLEIHVETETGTIGIEVRDAAGNVRFRQEKIGTESFEISDIEKCVVRIEAQRHKGRFEILGK